MNDLDTSTLIQWVAATICATVTLVTVSVYWYLRPLFKRKDDDQT